MVCYLINAMLVSRECIGITRVCHDLPVAVVVSSPLLPLHSQGAML